MAGNGEAIIDRIGADVGAESKMGNARRAFGGVVSDGQGDRLAQMVAKTWSNQIFDIKKGGAEGAANALGIKGGVVGTRRNVASKGSKQFGRTVEGGVRGEQISKEVKAAGFEVASSMDRGSKRNQKLIRIGGATEG
jgi:hypothetical protein